MEVFWEQGPRGGTYAICEKQGSVSGVADTSEGVKHSEVPEPRCWPEIVLLPLLRYT